MIKLLRHAGMVYLLCQARYTLAETDKSAQLQNPLLQEKIPTIGTGDYLQMILALVFIIALILMVAWVMRRMAHMPTSSKGVLKVITGMSIGQRERVVLIQAGKTQLLLGIAPGEVRTLHVFDEPVIDASNQGEPLRFADRLNAAIKQRLKR